MVSWQGRVVRCQCVEPLLHSVQAGGSTQPQHGCELNQAMHLSRGFSKSSTRSVRSVSELVSE